MADDDELASLAEALLAKKRFKTEDELTKIDGRWYWALPQGQRFIPRHTDALQLRTTHFGRWYTIENANSVEVGKC
ncbi:hypothetical protein KC339_g66 [Hortaea werneckii]|nr:hypothetical protein KC339_g66 [Hortaea werneckii]